MDDKLRDLTDYFIRQNAGSMTVREIAEATGLSKSAVDRRIKSLGLRSAAPSKGGTKSGTRGTAQAGKHARREEPSDDLGERLYELRDILYERLQDATPATVSRISAEYRAVLVALEEHECGQADDDGDDILAELMERYANR